MGDVRNFKKFLEGNGILREYIELRLEFMSRFGQWNEVARRDPSEWLLLTTNHSPEWYNCYSGLDERWCALCGTSWAFRKARVPAEPGMPLDDPLGLRLVLAELDEQNG